MAPAFVGPYEVVRELGRGGMGVVYEVRDPRVADRRLALKLILPGAASDEALARFAREAQLLARVKHPNVVAIHAFARVPEGPYLVTDFVQGEPLSRRVEWTPTAAATLVLALCDAVAALHAQGIVHRDLKPDNVIVCPDGSPVLLDFGIARGAGAESLTQSGVVVGTPHYMAPEQAEGKNVVALDARADVYGLGAVLFHLLSGRRPFDERDGAVALLRAVLDLEPRWPSEHDRRDVPRELEAVCRKAMQKDPARRYDTARALGQDLARWLAGERPHAAAHLRPSGRARRVGVVAAALLVVAIVARTRPGPALEPALEATSITTAAVATRAPASALPAPPPPRDRAPLARARLLPPGRGALAWSGDALVAAGGGSVATWSLPHEPVVTRVAGRQGESILTTDPTGTRVVVGWAGGGYCIAPPDGVNFEPETSPDESPISALALSPGAGTLALGSTSSRKVFLISLDGTDALRSLAFPQLLADMAWSRDGRWLACAASDVGAGTSVLRVFRREDRAWKEPRELTLPFVLTCVDVAPDSSVVAGDDAGRVVVLPPGDAPEVWLGVLDEASGLAGLRAHTREVHDLVVAEDGRRLYSLGPSRDDGSELRVWDLPGRRQLALVPLAGLSNRLAVTRDGRRLALSGPDGQVEVWEVDALLAPPGG